MGGYGASKNGGSAAIRTCPWGLLFKACRAVALPKRAMRYPRHSKLCGGSVDNRISGSVATRRTIIGRKEGHSDQGRSPCCPCPIPTRRWRSKSWTDVGGRGLRVRRERGGRVGEFGRAQGRGVKPGSDIACSRNSPSQKLLLAPPPPGRCGERRAECISQGLICSPRMDAPGGGRLLIKTRETEVSWDVPAVAIKLTQSRWHDNQSTTLSERRLGDVGLAPQSAYLAPQDVLGPLLKSEPKRKRRNSYSLARGCLMAPKSMSTWVPFHDHDSSFPNNLPRRSGQAATINSPSIASRIIGRCWGHGPLSLSGESFAQEFIRGIPVRC